LISRVIDIWYIFFRLWLRVTLEVVNQRFCSISSNLIKFRYESADFVNVSMMFNSNHEKNFDRFWNDLPCTACTKITRIFCIFIESIIFYNICMRSALCRIYCVRLNWLFTVLNSIRLKKVHLLTSCLKIHQLNVCMVLTTCVKNVLYRLQLHFLTALIRSFKNLLTSGRMSVASTP
jgi:hypothetical protein